MNRFLKNLSNIIDLIETQERKVNIKYDSKNEVITRIHNL